MRKLLSTTLAVGIFASMGITPVYADVVPNTLPTYNSAGSSNVQVSNPYMGTDNRYTMDIKIDDGNQSAFTVGTANWNDFNIGSNSTVNVLFTNNNQTSINKVAATGGLSQIYGHFIGKSADNCGGVCNYQSTGKVILLNPNGVLFGSGANVDINSFTASNLHGTWVPDEREDWEGYGTLQLRKYNDGEVTYTSDRIPGVRVEDNATIKTDTNLTFVGSELVDLYKDSVISTNTTGKNITYVNNEPTESFGKTYLVTSDGINFTYQRHGGIRKMENNVSDSDTAMKININGDIETGNLNVYNYSANKNSEININGAKIKAVKAEKGNDGSIYLESDSRIIADGSTFTVGGDLTAKAKQKLQLNSGTVNATGNVNFETTTAGTNEAYEKTNSDNIKNTYYNDGTLIVHDSTINANNINLKSLKAASVQGGSTITGADVTIDGGKLGYVVHASEVDSDNFTISADNIWFDRAKVKASNKISATANDGNILSMDNTGNGAESSFDANEIELTASGDVLSSKNVTLPDNTEAVYTGIYNFNDKKTTINAGRDIDVKVKGVKSPDYGLTAVAGRHVKIETPETLSVSKLVAGNGDTYTTGDMTIKASEVIKGLPYAGNDYRIENVDDSSYDRSLISVKKGTFSSQTVNGDEDEYYVTHSTDKIGETNNYMRHHLQYGKTSDSEKFVLLNPRAERTPRIPENNNNNNNSVPAVAALSLLNVNDGLVTKNKLPRQTEIYNDNTNISNNRVALVDVFAAASQIEIEDDED